MCFTDSPLTEQLASSPPNSHSALHFSARPPQATLSITTARTGPMPLLPPFLISFLQSCYPFSYTTWCPYFCLSSASFTVGGQAEAFWSLLYRALNHHHLVGAGAGLLPRNSACPAWHPEEKCSSQGWHRSDLQFLNGRPSDAWLPVLLMSPGSSQLNLPTAFRISAAKGKWRMTH